MARYTGLIGVWLRKSDYDRIREQALQNDLSASAFVRVIITKFLKEQEKQEHEIQ